MKKNKTTDRTSVLGIFYRVLSNCSDLCLFKLAKFFSFFISNTRNQVSTFTRDNIKLCFPELSAAEQKKLYLESIHHTSCNFFELASVWNQPVEQVLSKINSKHVDSTFYQEDHPKIIIAPHHGSWELLNIWLASTGPLYSLYKPARTAALDRYILKNRTRNGAVLVPANVGGLRNLLKALKKNASCMILPDQRPAKDTAQIEAPFFNIPAPTSLLIKKLISKVNCNVFIAAVTRDLTSAEYNLSVLALKQETFLKDDFTSASYLNESIQNLITRNIPQYQWAYRRYSVETYKPE